jgi:hypothetical protein
MIINYDCETFIVQDTGWQQRVQRVEEEKQQNMNNIMTDLSKVGDGQTPWPNVIKHFTVVIYDCSLKARVFIPGSPFPCGLYYKTSMIVIYNRNDSSQYYKTTITIVFTILARAKAEASLS